MAANASKYFFMGGKNSRKVAIGRSSPNIDLIAFWQLLENLKHIDQWPRLQFSLDPGVLNDYPPTDLVGRICSPRLADVIGPFAPETLWLPVQLCREDDELEYRFMHCPSRPDVLDEQKTKFVGGRVFTPHLSETKVGHLAVFCLRPAASSAIVRRDVRDAIRNAGCTGLEFEAVDAS